MAEIFTKTPVNATPQPDVADVVMAIPGLIIDLATALDRKGVLSLDEFKTSIVASYDAFDEETAGAGAGFLYEQVLKVLNGMKG